MTDSSSQITFQYFQLRCHEFMGEDKKDDEANIYFQLRHNVVLEIKEKMMKRTFKEKSPIRNHHDIIQNENRCRTRFAS